MIKFNTIGQVEHGAYPFEDATIAADVKNGSLGNVAGGAFTVAAKATKAVMNEEVGDDAGLDEYVIPSKSHVRVVDLTKVGKFEIYGHPLPDTFAKDNKLVSEASGALKVESAPSAPYFKIDEVIYVGGVAVGAVVEVVTA